MTGSGWLGHRILDIVTAEAGASFDELAERLGVRHPEVMATVWHLYRAGQVDVCRGRYAIAIPRPAAAEGGRAA